MYNNIEYRSVAKKTTCLLAGLGLTFASASVSAIDIDAGDYVPAPVGTNLALLYLQYASSDSLYSDGNKAPGDNGLDTRIGIFRAVHFMELWGMTVDPQILIPFGEVEAKGDLSGPLGDTSGIGDPILAATFWVQEDRNSGQFTGITPYLIAPLGSYDNDRPLNLGQNRWQFILQAAHVRPVSENISLDVAGDVTFYGENDELGPQKQSLKQDPSFQAQGFLRYHLSPTSDLRLGLSHTFGGETKVDGARQDDRISRTKYNLGGSFFIGDSYQVLALWGQDIENENGFKESSRVNVRLLKVF